MTSVEWDPNDDTVLAVGGDDHQISVWDFSVTDKKVPGELPSEGRAKGVQGHSGQLP